MENSSQKKIILNDEDKKWIATGCNSSFCEMNLAHKKQKLKQKLKESILGKNEEEFHYANFDEAFPNISTYFRVGLFKKAGDVNDYFEFLGDVEVPEFKKGNQSHNVLLYREVGENSNSTILADNEICAVKPIDFKTGQIWGFGGIYENLPIEDNFFNEKQEGRYALLHGQTKKGLVVIKSITKEDFLLYKSWFESLHKKELNPYKNNKLTLEKLIYNRFLK